MGTGFRVTVIASGLLFVAAFGNAQTNAPANSAAGAQASCDAGKAGTELSGAEAQAVYQCIEAQLAAGYRQGDKAWVPPGHVNDYREWTRASQFPAAPGVHVEQFLMTWVNPTGASEYLKYAEDPSIPPGTVIAKESFSVNGEGKVSPGPLFLMEKVAAGRSPQTDDWYYMMVAPNGAPMAIDVVTACSDCHTGVYGHQGGLGYPVEEARIGN